MNNYYSSLAPKLELFERHRRAGNRWSNDSNCTLHKFDKMCAEQYLNDTILTQEILDSWCTIKENESNKSAYNRWYIVIAFAKFEVERGYAIVNIPRLPKLGQRTSVPHSFTTDELTRFFTACDNIPLAKGLNKSDAIARKLTISTFFRLLYSTGMRTCEALKLKRVNVNLADNVIEIIYSKGTDQHFIALHESTSSLLRKYDNEIDKLYPNREYFFQSPNNCRYSHEWLTKNFRKIWYSVNSCHATPYDFRHNYAITNINKWVGIGLEFNDKLTYLSKSMGHCSPESTKYYYSITAGLADVLFENTSSEFDWIVPEA